MEPENPPGITAPKSSKQLFLRRALGFTFGTTLAVALFSFTATYWNAYTLPQELKSAVMLASVGGDTTVYLPQKFSYKKMPYRGGDIDAVTQNGKTVITVRKEGAEYILEENGSERIREVLPIAAPSLEPRSAGSIIYAQAVEPQKEAVSQISMVNSGQYEIRIYSPSNGKTARIISGYAPLFLDSNHFLFFGASGVYRYDLISGSAEKVLNQPFVFVFGTILQSPDRALFAFTDPIKEKTYVYKNNGSSVDLVMEIPEIVFSPALSNDALYGVKGTAQGGEVWKYPLGISKAQLVHRFPWSLAISRIVF